MSDDAVIRIQLDTSGAKSKLDALYGQMSQAPPIHVGGGSGGTGARGAPVTGVVGGAGAIALAPTLAKLAAAAAALSVVGTAGPGAMLSTAKDELRYAALGPALGTARGALRSRDAVASQLGTAVEFGLVGQSQVQSLYETMNAFGPGAQARGEAKVNAMLGSSVRSSIQDAGVAALKDAAIRMVPLLAEIKDAVNAFGK